VSVWSQAESNLASSKIPAADGSLEDRARAGITMTTKHGRCRRYGPRRGPGNARTAPR